MSEVFRTQQQVRFAHCDAAGWMFYPRAFELINGVVEDWFADALGKPFKTLHLDDRLSVPTVHLDADFRSPSRLGEVLEFELTVAALGRTSVTLAIAARADGAERFAVRATIVFADLAARPVPIPDALRLAMARYQVSETI